MIKATYKIMGKIYLGDSELTPQQEVNTISGNVETVSGNVTTLSSTTIAHTADTTVHVTQSLLDRINALENQVLYKGHAYVEIGGKKWATMNIGASSVTDYGLYFQWGDTQGYTAEQVGSGEGKKYFYWTDYKYSDNGTSAMTKYNQADGKKVLDASDDAVQAAWGGSWRMPTFLEYYNLGNAVNTAWTADYQGSGVGGIVCTDKTDSSKVLFFPTAGYCSSGSVTSVSSLGVLGSYWSNTVGGSSLQTAYYVNINSQNVSWTESRNRYFGRTVRGIAN